MKRLIIAGLVGGLLLAPVPAYAATGDGTLTLKGGDSNGLLVYRLHGKIVPLRTASVTAGISGATSFRNSDDRYVNATLTTATRDPWVETCDGGTVTSTWEGVDDSAAIVTTNLVLNKLTGKGRATIAITTRPSWLPGYVLNPLLPGTANVSYSYTCSGDDLQQSLSLPVISGAQPDWSQIFIGDVNYVTEQLDWPLLRKQGKWYAKATKRVTDYSGDTKIAVSTDIVFSGSATSMHARCYPPTTRQLKPAKTAKAARKILAKAGFPSVKLTKPKFSGWAKKGHFYLSNLTGNGNPLPCGWTGIKLTKSKGWPPR